MKVTFDQRPLLSGGLAAWLVAGGVAIGYFLARRPPANADIRRDAVVEAINKVWPSVVNIATSTIVEKHDALDDIFRDFFRWDRPAQRREELNSIGSGVIIDEDGYVLTNLHVLERATRVQVKLSNGLVYDAEPIVATTDSDVALLKLTCPPGQKFKAIKFARDDDLLLGETVLALGNPFGLGASVSRGILSSKNCRPRVGDEPLYIQDWLQTDAAINPGNSGGPLINLRGELIGLNVKRIQTQGIGFAIPIKQVSAALAEFFLPEVIDSLWFGVHLTAGPAPFSIATVQPGSPAYQAGLREGQQIVEVNGKTPKDVVDFNRLVSGSKDHTAALVVQQYSERHTVQAQLVPFDDLIRQKLGLGLVKLTPQLGTNFPFQAGKCMFIDKVEDNSPAARAQLPRESLLTAIDDRRTDSLLSVADVLSSKKPGESVRLSVVVRRRMGNADVEFQEATVAVPVR